MSDEMSFQQNGSGCSDNGSPAWQTDDCFSLYNNNELRGPLQSAENGRKVSCINVHARAKARDLKYFELNLAGVAHREYTGLQHCVASILVKEAEQMKSHSADIIKAKGAITVAMNAAADMIKAAKEKAWQAREAACKLEACIEDSCNAEQLSALSALPAEEEGGLSGRDLFKAKTAAIIEATKNAHNSADDVFEQSIKIAGMLALINADSVSSRVELLHTSVTALQSDIKGGIEAATKHVNEATGRYQESLVSYVESGTLLNRANTALNGLNRTRTEVNILRDSPTPGDCADADYMQELRDLCMEINSLMTEGMDCQE